VIKHALVAAAVLAVADGARAQAQKAQEQEQEQVQEQEQPEQSPPEARSRRPRAPKASLPRPSEADLGVPVYPGARYDGDVSGGMSQPDHTIWIFFSDDAPAKVVAFYEKKTGKKASEWDKDKYMIALKGASVIPEHGVTVETLAGNPLFPGKGKTVITVSRTRPSQP
jgi:hypothetical protein